MSKNDDDYGDSVHKIAESLFLSIAASVALTTTEEFERLARTCYAAANAFDRVRSEFCR